MVLIQPHHLYQTQQKMLPMEVDLQSYTKPPSVTPNRNSCRAWLISGHGVSLPQTQDVFVLGNLICISIAGTMKSLKREGFITAHEIAVCKGYNDLVSILEPKAYHIIPSSSLEKLETNVHSLMQKLAGDKVFYSYPIF